MNQMEWKARLLEIADELEELAGHVTRHSYAGTMLTCSARFIRKAATPKLRGAR